MTTHGIRGEFNDRVYGVRTTWREEKLMTQHMEHRQLTNLQPLLAAPVSVSLKSKVSLGP